jgi:hypothetical protein
MIISGMAKEHRIPLVRIRCLNQVQAEKLKRVWRGLGGKPPPRQLR